MDDNTIMCYSKKINKKEIIFCINQKVLDDFLVKKIIEDIENTHKKIGLDLHKVTSIHSNLFIKYLKQDKFKLFNIQNETMVYLSIILKNGFLKSFINYEDFKHNKREFFKRTLKVV